MTATFRQCCIELTCRKGPSAVDQIGHSKSPHGKRRQARTLAAVTFVVLFLAVQTAVAQAQSLGVVAAESSGTIQTVVVFRAKESDCPSGYVIYRAGTDRKFPTDPKICFVRDPRPAGQ